MVYKIAEISEWRIVKQPDGKYARFSYVVDSFTHGPLSWEEAYDLCKTRGCDDAQALSKMKAAEISEDQQAVWTHCLDTIKKVHGEEEVQIVLGELIPQLVV